MTDAQRHMLTYGSGRRDETLLIEVGSTAETDVWFESSPVRTSTQRQNEIANRAEFARHLARIRASRTVRS